VPGKPPLSSYLKPKPSLLYGGKSGMKIPSNEFEITKTKKFPNIRVKHKNTFKRNYFSLYSTISHSVIYGTKKTEEVRKRGAK
jgi:hypothetical protein